MAGDLSTTMGDESMETDIMGCINFTVSLLLPPISEDQEVLFQPQQNFLLVEALERQLSRDATKRRFAAEQVYQ